MGALKLCVAFLTSCLKILVKLELVHSETKYRWYCAISWYNIPNTVAFHVKGQLNKQRRKFQYIKFH